MKLGKLALFPRGVQPDGAAGGDLPDAEQPRQQVVKMIPALLDEDGTEFASEHVYLYALRHSYAAAPRGRGGAARHAAEADGPPDRGDDPDLLPGDVGAQTRSNRALAPLTMDKVGRRSDFTPRWSSPSGCGRRSAGSRSRSGTAPSSTTSRRSARTAHSAAGPRLGALSYLPLTPPRPLRLPRAALKLGSGCGPRSAAGGVGTNEGDSRRRRDQHRSAR